MLLGQKIKELRMENGVLQRQLASLLEIDTPMFSKIERGDRRAKRTQVIQIANYFNVDEKELLTLWVADKVLDAVTGEEELKIEQVIINPKTYDGINNHIISMFVSGVLCIYILRKIWYNLEREGEIYGK